MILRESGVMLKLLRYNKVLKGTYILFKSIFLKTYFVSDT